MNSTPPGTSPSGFLGRHWQTIVVGALLGLALGVVVAILAPASYRSTASVLITRLAVDELGGSPEVEPLPPIDSEIRFLNSGIVRDAVRDSIPTAPDTVDVELADEGNVLVLTASADSIDDAQRLARNWATAFIDQRQRVLVRTWEERTEVAAAILDDLVTEIGVARLALDDVEVERLEARRTAASTEQAQALARLDGLRAEPGAEVFSEATRPTSRSGAPLLPMTALGLVAGSALGAAWCWARDRRTENDDEANSWLDRLNEDPAAPLLTARELDIPAFLAPTTPPISLAPPPAAPAQPAPITPPLAEPAPTPPVAPAPLPDPVAAAAVVVPEAPPAPTPVAPTPAAPAPVPAAVSTQRTQPAPSEPASSPIMQRATNGGLSNGGRHSVTGPLRVVQLSVEPKPTRAPRRSAADEAWSDDIALVTDQ